MVRGIARDADSRGSCYPHTAAPLEEPAASVAGSTFTRSGGAGVLLPFTPLGALFGLQPLPPLYYAFLVATVAAYLAAVELAKQAIYRRSIVIRLK